MAKRQRDAEREAFWRKTLRRRERSGLTVVEFCRREELSPTTYHFWRREIKRRDSEQQRTSRSRSGVTAAPTFAPVQVVADPEGAAIEVIAPNGLIVRVPESAAPGHTRRILELVSEISGSQR